MKNAITLQDEYIAKVLSYDPKGATYYTLLTRAAKVLRRELATLGFGQPEAQKAWEDAWEMAELARACGAKSREECICDDLNDADQYICPTCGSAMDRDPAEARTA